MKKTVFLTALLVATSTQLAIAQGSAATSNSSNGTRPFLSNLPGSTSGVMSGAKTIETPSKPDTSMFPKAGNGVKQHVFILPKQSEENQYRVEIVASKSLLADCNHIMISADLYDETLPGWGYHYYEIDNVSKPASTMMACPDNKKTQKLVSIQMGKDAMIRYNSKLPVVVYAPEDIKVSYRVWQTSGTVHRQN